MTHHERVLRRGVNSYSLVGDIRDGNISFHGVGIGHGKIVITFDNGRSVFESLIDVTPFDLMLLANICPFAGRHFTFEATQRAGLELFLV